MSFYFSVFIVPSFTELGGNRSEFSSDTDAIHAFEDYLRATKASLTANEIAKIRDHTGIVGMAGT